jgi:hypothetical protein
VFERAGLGGSPAAADPARTFHIAVENRTATKLDYFVKPSIRQQVVLTPAGDARIRTTVVLDNQAPTGAAPSEQLGPDQFTKRPGDYLAWVLLWAPAGSSSASTTVAEAGLRLSQRVLEVAAGQRRETTFETTVRHAVTHGMLRLRLVPQPRLTPMPIEVSVAEANGWRVDGSGSWSGALDQARVLSWRVRR